MVIGMEQGLMGMCVGERRRLVIPPHLGYGERGVGKTLSPSPHTHMHTLGYTKGGETQTVIAKLFITTLYHNALSLITTYFIEQTLD